MLPPQTSSDETQHLYNPLQTAEKSQAGKQEVSKDISILSHIHIAPYKLHVQQQLKVHVHCILDF